MEKQWNLTNVSSFFCLFYIIKGVGTEATYDNDSENVFDDKFNSSAHALNIRNILPSSSAKHIYMLKNLVYGYY